MSSIRRDWSEWWVQRTWVRCRPISVRSSLECNKYRLPPFDSSNQPMPVSSNSHLRFFVCRRIESHWRNVTLSIVQRRRCSVTISITIKYEPCYLHATRTDDALLWLENFVHLWFSSHHSLQHGQFTRIENSLSRVQCDQCRWIWGHVRLFVDELGGRYSSATMMFSDQ